MRNDLRPRGAYQFIGKLRDNDEYYCFDGRFWDFGDEADDYRDLVEEVNDFETSTLKLFHDDMQDAFHQRFSVSMCQLDLSNSTNPKDKIGIKKPPMSYIPPVFKAHVAMAFKNGANKYGAYNWRSNKVQMMIYLDAMLRHIDAVIDGEDIAEDSQVDHLAHVAACCGIILDAKETGNLIDNRPPKGNGAEVLRRLTTC